MVSAALLGCGDREDDSSDEDSPGSNPSTATAAPPARGVDALERNEALFTTAGFDEALASAEESVGATAQVLRLRVTRGFGANFVLRKDGEQVDFVYFGGAPLDRKAEILDASTVEAANLSLSEVDPEAIDKMVESVESVPDENLQVVILTLDSRPPEGLHWVITVQGGTPGGRTGGAYYADLDGSNIRRAPPSKIDQSDVNRCIKKVGAAPERLLPCLDK